MNTTTRILVPFATAALVAGLAAAPAAAERVSYADPADTSGASLNDIRRVTVDHGAQRAVVRVKVEDLRRRSEAGSAGLTVRIDTRSDRRGPEFRLSTGMYDGTDYQLQRMRRGKVVGDPLTCAHRVRLDFARDRVVVRAGAACLGSPDQIRVGVKMTDLYDGSHPITDWLGEPGSWTGWVTTA